MTILISCYCFGFQIWICVIRITLESVPQVIMTSRNKGEYGFGDNIRGGPLCEFDIFCNCLPIRPKKHHTWLHECNFVRHDWEYPITNSDLNRPCFAWHPYGKSGLFKIELVIVSKSHESELFGFPLSRYNCAVCQPVWPSNLHEDLPLTLKTGPKIITVNRSWGQFWIYTTLREKRVLKQYPWGTIATNGTLFSKGHSFFLNNHVYGKKSAPEQKGTIFQKSAPKGTVLQKKVGNGTLF